MKITKIVAISAFGILLSACNSNQMQKEAPVASSAPEAGASHVHSVEGHGDLNHKHTGDSSSAHSHSYEQIVDELKQ